MHLLEQDRDSVADELEAENANNANAALETTKTTGKEKLDVKVIFLRASNSNIRV